MPVCGAKLVPVLEAIGVPVKDISEYDMRGQLRATRGGVSVAKDASDGAAKDPAPAPPATDPRSTVLTMEALSRLPLPLIVELLMVSMKNLPPSLPAALLAPTGVNVGTDASGAGSGDKHAAPSADVGESDGSAAKRIKAEPGGDGAGVWVWVLMRVSRHIAAAVVSVCAPLRILVCVSVSACVHVRACVSVFMGVFVGVFVGVFGVFLAVCVYISLCVCVSVWVWVPVYISVCLRVGKRVLVLLHIPGVNTAWHRRCEHNRRCRCTACGATGVCLQSSDTGGRSAQKHGARWVVLLSFFGFLLSSCLLVAVWFGVWSICVVLVWVWVWVGGTPPWRLLSERTPSGFTLCQIPSVSTSRVHHLPTAVPTMYMRRCIRTHSSHVYARLYVCSHVYTDKRHNYARIHAHVHIPTPRTPTTTPTHTHARAGAFHRVLAQEGRMTEDGARRSRVLLVARMASVLHDAALDAALVRFVVASPKDRAELALVWLYHQYQQTRAGVGTAVGGSASTPTMHPGEAPASGDAAAAAMQDDAGKDVESGTDVEVEAVHAVPSAEAQAALDR